MRMRELLVSQAKRVLTQLVSQIAARVPSVRGSVSENLVHGISTVCASFLKAPEADTVDFCVEIKTDADYVTVSADLVVGGSGRMLSEMAAVTIRKDRDIEAAVRVLEKYVLDHADTMVAELR